MKKKKISRLFFTRMCACSLALVMAGTMIPVYPVMAKTSQEEQTQDAADTQMETIEIASAKDLEELAENCHIDEWSKNKLVNVTADIDLSGSDFLNIPVFSGVFKGNGHKIINYRYNGNGYVTGFFRYIEEGGIVEDLYLSGNVTSEDEKQCIGAICGINSGTIRNCTFQGLVEGKYETGGIAGINEGTGTIQGCTTKGTVTGYYYTGGTVGKNFGSVDNCSNYANINNNSQWVEEDDEISVDILQNIRDNETDVKVASGVDTGGIVGFSKGVIMRCTNVGKIGYEHTGYNIGGIVGRQSGVVALCTNHGTVYGRKDIGGIVGQMEPYIEIDAAESIRDAVNKLHDLIQKTLDDMEEGTNVIQNDVDVLKNYSDAVVDQSDTLSNRLSNFADNNIDQVNNLTDRMESVLDMLPGIMNNTDAAGNSLTDLNNALKKLNEDLNISDKMSSSSYNETDYRRLSVVSSVGGSASSDNINPDEGALVTITVKPDNGYELNGISVSDANGKGITTNQTGSDTYTFTMPKENVLVSVVYNYTGAFLAQSNEGGNITVTEKDNDQVEITAEPYNGYELAGNSVSIGGSSAALTDNKVTVNRSSYISGSKPVIVEGQFNKKSNTYKVTPVSGTGGTVTVESQEAATGDTVTIHVAAAYNYSVKSVTYNGTAATASTSNAGEYTFTMPAADVSVEALFQYSGDKTDSVVYAESTVGGTVTAVRSAVNGEQYNVTMTPNSGYEIPDNDCLEISKVIAGAVEATPSQVVSKSEMTQEGDSYRYLLTKSSSTPLQVYGKFTKTSGTQSITCTSGTGGVITASSSSASQGDEIYLVSATQNGYRLKSLSVKTVSGTEVSYQTESKRYTFNMPSEDVRVTAVYEPIQLMVTSNAGGSASYTGGNDTKVTLKVTPDSGYTVASTPVVKDKNGNTISMGKASAGTFTYEFYLDSAAEPATAQITFQKQNQDNATQDALDRINANAGTLNGKSNDISMSIDRIRQIITDDDGNVKDWSSLTPSEKTELLNEVSDLMDYTSQAGTAASEILSDLALIASIEAPYIKDAASAAHSDLDTASKYTQNIIDSLKSASNGARGIVNYLNGQSDLNFSKLGDEFDDNMDTLHSQLRGMTDSIKAISDHAANYSDKVNQDLEAVNDQLNVVFNLFIDKIENLDNTDENSFYSDVSDEEIETATTGRVDNSTNKGIVQGDINVGGIAGAMAIDEEDPEDNAAGSTDFSLGDSYTTKCIINGSTNQGYVTSKKDGAGGIAGYMKYGVITDCKGLGAVESTEGDYVGGICGQSLALIKNSYVLCTLTGGNNVGGIAGFGTNIKDCYSMANIADAKARYGAIAGQIALNDEDEQDTNTIVTNNYYVGDDIYGIDNISYIGIAEPITYEALLAVEGMPTDFWHLKVTYKIDDMYLGTQELAYGDSLSKLTFPEAPAKDNCYGVWPDVSDRIMTGNLVIEGEYKDNVTVVQSDNTNNMLASAEGEHEKALVLVEGVFTEDAVLHASVSDEAVPQEVTGKNDYTVYQVSLDNTTVTGADTLAVRLLNPYNKATVWNYRDGEWQQVDSKVRGQYLQTTMKGAVGMFCIVEETSNIMKIVIIAVSAAVVVLLLLLIKKIAGKHKTKDKKEKKEKKPKKQKPAKKSKEK